jgi:hypothetical protein
MVQRQIDPLTDLSPTEVDPESREPDYNALVQVEPL